MFNTTHLLCSAMAVSVAALTSLSTGAAAPTPQTPATALWSQLTHHAPGVRASLTQDGRISRIFGQTMATGATPRAAADAFIDAYSGLWGVPATDLVAGMPQVPGQVHVGLGWDAATQRYRFTATTYTQQVNGIPVFGSRLMVLSLNEPDAPIVWAGADLRDVSELAVPTSVPTMANKEATAIVSRLLGGHATLHAAPALVLWAGVESTPAPPALAWVLEGSTGSKADDTYDRRLFLVDANSQVVLHAQNRILNCGPQCTHATVLAGMTLATDIEGTISALATEDSGADECHEEVVEGMPYARVSAGSSVAYADADGNFTLSNSGTTPVTVTSAVRGEWFRVYNEGGSDSSLSESVTPPGPVDFLHNAANNSETVRAEVNSYNHANRVRDFVLTYHPTFPVIYNQTEFPVNVNLSSNCNAFYDYSSINFYSSGGGCNNTAFSVIVHHEYGHHLVSCAGSGQGEYGEGMGDVMGVLITGDPHLARGFYQGDCTTGIRNADNDCQYSNSCSTCGSSIHACGQLISGIAWDIREGLMGIPDGLDVINSLAINAMLMHNGTSINQDIAIDYLTLDDTDGDISNGTPHYSQIAAGFEAHGIDVPDLALLSLTLPDGLPAMVDPNGSTSIQLSVEELDGTLDPDSPKIHVHDGDAFVAYPMDLLDEGLYMGRIPATECGTNADFYFSAMTTSGVPQTLPSGAPLSYYSVLAATSDPVLIYEETFQTDTGWVVSNSAADGGWGRGVPVTGCDRGNPQTDGDGSGACYLTDNSAADGCNSDVDDGTTTVTSPTLDISGGNTLLSYWRWFSNSYGAGPYSDRFITYVSDNNGASWRVAEEVGPSGPECDGGWYSVTISLAEIPEFEQNDQFKVRFYTEDLDPQSVVEAAVDGVTLLQIDCDSCTGDVTGDGVVGVNDILEVIAHWGPCQGCDADVTGDGVVGTGDLLAVLDAWGACDG
jgi:hypothetical protein